MSEKFVEVEMFSGDYEVEDEISHGIVIISEEHKVCYNNGERNFHQECLICNFWRCGSHEGVVEEDNQQCKCKGEA